LIARLDRVAISRESLPRNADRNSGAGISAVVQVVAVVVGDVNVVIVIPVIPPIFWPWINQTQPVAVVLEAGISAYNQEWQAMDAEPVLRPKVSPEAVVRNAVAAVASALLPVAMIAVPML
jgi:hypothetical protein